MKAYPSYKESGVEAIGNIPEHWHISSLKRLIHDNLMYGANESAELDDKELPRYIRITDFDDNGNLRENTFRSLPHEIAKDYLLSEGDILFARSGATVGKTFQFKNYNGKACFAGYLIKASPDKSKILSDFLYLFTKSNSYDFWKNSIFIQATIQNIGANKYQYLEVPVPSLAEQKVIADYLNRKTAQIDTLIEKKQRQIDLLQEQRDVMTQNAMRSSEAKSLKLGDVADWIKRPINRQDEELYERIGLYNRGRGIFHKPIAKGVDLGDSDFFEIKDGDFVISGQFAWEGAVALARKEEDGFFASHRYYSLRGKPDYTETAYLFSFFTTQLGDNLLNHHSRGAAGRNRPLNINTLLREKIPVPPLSMQKPITELIEKTVVLKKNTQKLVDFLQEYRMALISEAVTGKIDVRTS